MKKFIFILLSVISINCFGQTYHSSYYGNGVSVHSTTRISGSYGSISGTYSISSGGYHSSGSFHYSTSIPSYSSYSSYSLGYSNYSNTSTEYVNDSIIKEETSIEYSEIPAEFPGGIDNLMIYLHNNIKYHNDKTHHRSGRVIVKFTITNTGDIKNVEIVKSLDKYCDNEAIRVIKNMPKWEPGTNCGKPVSTYFTVPVYFK